MRAAQPGTSVAFMDLAAAHAELRPALDEVWSRTVCQSAFIGGEQVERFEAAFADHVGVEHAVGVANGTDAIELALRSLGIGPGDEVVVPANTFVATSEAVHATGATPVFVDVDPDTLLTTPHLVEARLGPRTAAMVVVHLFGQPVDLDAFEALSRRHGVALVEDAAQAHGASWCGRRAGSVGSLGCFSFYPGKNLGAVGDGGAVVTDDEELAGRVRSLANHGADTTSPTGYGRVGRNSRLDGLQAGVLEVKLARLEQWNARRRRIWSIYRDGFADSSVRPVEVDPRATSACHLAVVQVPSRDLVRRRLADAGVGTGVHYPVPCHLLPPVADPPPRLPEVERAAGEILSLPMYPHLEHDAARTVVERVLEIVADTEAARAHA